jgi:histidinol dehydrogenase
MKLYISGRDNIEALFEALRERSFEARKDVEEVVSGILYNVKARGDQAVAEYTQKFDGVTITPENFEVQASELSAALAGLDRNLLRVLEKSAANIRAFHERQRENSWFVTSEDGSILGQKVTPLDRVGVYAPSGTAPLPSTVLMDIIPARVAGVREIILCSPPMKNGKVNPLILACAKIAGADRVFAVGGAQAIGAMAYGTKTIPAVDKIAGPGNIYVTTAKKQVFGTCGIDMTAGPSEVLVIADRKANPEYVAADLLSQAEHDAMASAILITTSPELAEAVLKAVEAQAARLGRNEIISESLDKFGAAVVIRDLGEAVEIVNRIAPEHLEICTEDPFSLLPGIRNAGAIFLGEYSPEPVGDYFAGPNHTIPTAGGARFFSPLGVYDFVKRSSVVSYSRKAFTEAAPYVAAFAEAEGLQAHAESVKIRVTGD